jgi:hypothetical protein
MAKNTAAIPAKITGSSYAASEFEVLRDFVDAPAQKLTTFTDTNIIVDGTKSYSTVKAITASTHTITASDVDGNAGTALSAEHEENNYLSTRYSFSQDCTLTFVGIDTVGSKTGTIDPIPSGTYDIYFIAGTFGVQTLIKNNESGATGTAPSFSAITRLSDTEYQIDFDLGVYGANDGSSPVVASDLEGLFTQGAYGIATGVSTLTVTKTNDTALTGGETSIKATVGYNGTPNGYEQIRFSPNGATAIYSADGTAMSDSDQTSNVYLNAQSYTTFDGVNDFVDFGDLLDNITVGTSKRFTFECDVNGLDNTATIRFWNKFSASPGGVAFNSYMEADNDVFMSAFADQTDGASNLVRIENDGSSITANKLTWKYDQTQSVADGILEFYIDDVLQTVTTETNAGTFDSIENTASHLGFGALLDESGVEFSTLLKGNARNIKFIDDVSGDTLINVPQPSVGIDISGNDNHGTWNS